MNFVLKIVVLCIAVTFIFASKSADVHNELVIRTKRPFFPKESFKDDNDPFQNGLDSLDLLLNTVNQANKEPRSKSTMSMQAVSSKIILSTQKKSNEQVIKDKLTALKEKQHSVPSIEAVAVAAFLTGRRGAIKVPK